MRHRRLLLRRPHLLLPLRCRRLPRRLLRRRRRFRRWRVRYFVRLESDAAAATVSIELLLFCG